MGIRTKNLHHHIITLRSAGTLTAATSKDIAKALMSGFITNVVGKLLTPGSGSTATICDVHMNGTTIFDAATKMTFAATTGISVTYGSMFSLDVDSISTNPANVVVQITVSRTPLALASNNEDQAEVL
jgi:hypothetical protein